MDDNDILMQQIELYKPDFLISAKYKSSLVGNKILLLALSRIKRDDDKSPYKAVIPAADIRKALNIKGNGFYETLRDASIELQKYGQIGFSDPVNKTFEYMTVVTTCKYADGIFTLEFNHNLSDYLNNLKIKFTILNIAIMMQFKSVFSFRLYEILKSEAYAKKNKSGKTINISGNSFVQLYNVSELKFMLGLADINDVIKLVDKKNDIDYDEALSKVEDQSYKDWRDFKKRVLDVATKEINEKSDLNITYECLRNGKGAKITDLLFKITIKDTDTDNKPDYSKKQDIIDTDAVSVDELEKDKEDVFDNMVKLFKGEFKMKEMQTIAETADYDFSKIEKAYKIMKSNRNVDNATGFMIKAIKEEWTNNKKKSASSNSFNNFEQQTLEYTLSEEELESKFLSN